MAFPIEDLKFKYLRYEYIIKLSTFFVATLFSELIF